MSFSRLRYYLTSIPTLLWGVRNWPTVIAGLSGLPAASPVVVTLRDGLRFRVRTPLDLWILKETCLDRQYERAGTSLEDGWIILDIGAALGDFAIGAASRYPRSQVYAYEPFPASFALLQENLRLNRIQNVQAFPYALGAQVGVQSLRLVSPEAVQHTTTTGSCAGTALQVPGTTLDRVFAELHLSHCDYVKMDCEGAEYDILFHASEATVRQVRHFCLEYHDGVTDFSHHDLVSYFEARGFRVRLTPNPVHRRLGYLYAANEEMTNGEW
jgi:FkbM family methyltransferase